MASDMCIVRERRHDDLRLLADALVRVHARDGYPVEGVADPIEWLNHPGALQSWTALVNDVPVGQVTLTNADPQGDAATVWIQHTNQSVDRLAIIARLFVDPDYRNAGAGRSLVVAALTHAYSVGRSVALDVMMKDQDAIRLYERLGGQRLGTITHRYGDGLTEPAIVFGFAAAVVDGL